MLFLVSILPIKPRMLVGGSDGKESACSAGDLGLIPGLGRSPGGGHGNSLQYSCLQNPYGQRSLVGYNPWGHRESNTTERLTLSLSKPRCLRSSFVCELNVPCQIFFGDDIYSADSVFVSFQGYFLNYTFE